MFPPTQKIRVLVVDDSVLARTMITQGLSKSSRIDVVGTAFNAQDARTKIDRLKPDVMTLDVEMPGMNGIYVGNELKRANSSIIIFIVTSYSKYLDEAMRFQVFRYLSKPIDKQRFFRNMKDAVELYNTMTIKIPVETKQGIHTIPASDIIAIEAQARKVIVHTTLCDFESVHNMQYWLKELPKNCFFQTHRSFIINFEHITNFDHTLVNMDDNQIRAYLTKRKYSAFKEAYLLYLESTR